MTKGYTTKEINMAQTTVQGPVKSINGFIRAGVGKLVSLTGDTT